MMRFARPADSPDTRTTPRAMRGRRSVVAALAWTLLAMPASHAQARRVADAPCAPPDSLRVPILVYHNVEPVVPGRRPPAADLSITPDAFARQMAYLAEQGIPVVSLDALLDALEGRRSLPPRAVVITFDDGRVNQLVHAVPVLRRHGFTATFFPFVHAMDRNPRYFRWAQLRDVMEAGMSVGSHGVLHVRVDRITGDSLHREVAGSRALLRERLGDDATRFYSYPFGALSPAGDSAVRAAGYRGARAYGGGAWNSLATRWRLRSVPMTASMRRFVETVNPGAPPPPNGATTRSTR